MLARLYASHTLSTWNSRTFEFGAVLFLASAFPGTLAFASAYALVRAGAAALLSGWVGALLDRVDRLAAVRLSIVGQRLPVALSCAAFAALAAWDGDAGARAACFAGAAALACVEKLAIVGNTVAVERDWVVVIAEDVGAERQQLNAVMRRIDLLAKLLAPVFISVIDDFSHVAAIWVVFAQNLLSVLIEYFAIAQVYEAVPRLQSLGGAPVQPPDDYLSVHSAPSSPSSARRPSQTTLPKRTSAYFGHLIQPWVEYVQNKAFLASFSLSLLYFTVLSTGVQMQTYLFTLGFTSIEVSMMRLGAVAVELLATWAAPILMNKIGPVRSGLWFLNEQLACIAVSVALYMSATAGTKAAGYSLICGITFSRLGLWGFDLSVQYLVQEDVPEETRGKFSACEMALQNVSELISFATTIIWARPEQFEFPVLVSAGAVAVSACCFAAFVRERRGHLLHTSKCLKREKYAPLPQGEAQLGDVEAQQG